MTYTVELEQTTASSQDYRFVLLDTNQQPLGYARGEFRGQPQWYNGQKYFFLNHVIIDHKMNRHQGLGTQLIKAVEAFASQQGAYCIRGLFAYPATDYTSTQEADRALNAFWRKNGYGLKREVYDECLRIWKLLR